MISKKMVQCNIFFIVSFLFYIGYNYLMDKNIKLLLNTIANYCIENPDYCFWYSNKSNYYRLYLGYTTTYQKFKSGCEYSYGLINSPFIKETNLVFDYATAGNGVISKIQTYHEWDSKDMHRYKLFTYCRERVDNEFLYLNCFSTFFESRQEPVDIEKCLIYGKFKDINDWIFFTSNLTEKNRNDFWSNYPQVKILSGYFNEEFNYDEKKSFLAPLITSKNLQEINEQSLNLYKFLENIFNLDELKKYSHFPIVEKSLRNTDIFDTEERHTLVEKVVTNQNIFKFQNYEGYSINECNAIYISIISEMNENEQLQKCGLIAIDFIVNKKEYNNVFYINRKLNSPFSEQDFKEIFIQTLHSFSQNPKIEKLKEIIPTIVNNWYLQKQIGFKAAHTNQAKI